VRPETDVHAVGEVARGARHDAPDVERARGPLRQALYGIARRQHLQEIVAAAQRQHAERCLAARAHQAVDHLVHGAVAAGGDHRVDLVCRALREADRFARLPCLRYLEANAGAAQRRRLPWPLPSSPAAASGRVEDDEQSVQASLTTPLDFSCAISPSA
jgi:hypothetical protein